MAGAFQPGGLGRLESRDRSHIARFPLSAVMPAAAPFVCEVMLDPRFDVWPRERANQGQTLRCVGYSGQRGKVILDGLEFDPDWLWARAKERDGFGDEGGERGTTVHAANQVLCDLGNVRVKDGDDLAPDPAYGILAAGYATTVDEVRQCLASRIPVQIGIGWGSGYDDLQEVNGEPWTGRNGFGHSRGGHALDLDGGSDERQAVHLCGSWGYDQGWFSYEELERRLDDGGEAAIITDRPGPTIAPTPIPGPAPKPSKRIPAGAVSVKPLTLLSALNSGAAAVVLEDGIYFPLHLTQMSGLWIGARNIGKVAFRSGVADDRGPSVGLRFEECEDITLDGIGLANAGCGIRATDCRNFTLRRVYSHHHAVEGFLFGAHAGLDMDDCEAWSNQGIYSGEWGRSHGLYIAYGSRDVHVRNFYSHGNSGDAVHVNGDARESGEPCRDVTIENLRGFNCATGGGAAIEISSAERITVKNALLTWNADCPETDDLSRDNAGGVFAYAGDEGGPAESVTLENVSIINPGRSAVQVEDGSTVTARKCYMDADSPRKVDGDSTLTDDGSQWDGGAQKAGVGYQGKK